MFKKAEKVLTRAECLAGFDRAADNDTTKRQIALLSANRHISDAAAKETLAKIGVLIAKSS